MANDLFQTVPEARRRHMARVKGKDTKPEKIVRQTAHAIGLRFRLHRRDLPGTPDMVFPRLSTVVFVHGCFWHRHSGCRRCTTPKTRTEFWNAKFVTNVERDMRNSEQLVRMGWKVLVVWECETFDRDQLRVRLSNDLGSSQPRHDLDGNASPTTAILRSES
ncbi:very short patch repair endonuclease [Aureimonas jatrophae]|uniref:very short patch repair endonuclease n=1 Tax=Aureimonas jatrophae TaxID=1166073 RepID=UPI000AFB314D|nr:very short patch repair endonuclease [Aureimonas jatrophae]